MTIHLTKSRYMAGLQCPRRLWLLVHEPPLYEEPSPGSPLDIGQEIGRKAHLLFPRGVEIVEQPWEHAEAVARTAALMADSGVPAIFEAGFEYDGIRIRVDVLERLSCGTWGLREIKSSSGLKDHYIDDIALQAHVLRGTGLNIPSIELLAVNTAYVRGATGIVWPEYFARLLIRNNQAVYRGRGSGGVASRWHHGRGMAPAACLSVRRRHCLNACPNATSRALRQGGNRVGSPLTAPSCAARGRVPCP